MIIRKIKSHEIKRTTELYLIAFEFGSEESRSAEEVYEQILAHPNSREDFCWHERWAAFEDDDATMMSFMVAKPMPVHFDGNHMIMTGIGGVATLPQYRRRGGIRACFEAALPDMYENGVAFSYLFPFSTAYYRKFGYEMCCERIRYQVALEGIPAYDVGGRCYLLEPGSSLGEDIRFVYRNWQSRYNMMIENEDFEFAWIEQSDPVKDRVYTYVYKDADGLAKGFVSLSLELQGGERNLVCSRFFFADAEGVMGLLRLAKGFAADHNFIIFHLPVDQNISPLLPEWTGTHQRESFFHGMSRVINVEKVLRGARYRGSGTLVIDIKDPYVMQNNKRLRVSFAEGELKELLSVDEAADVSLTIADFSRLIIGAFHPDMLDFYPSIRIHSGRDVFDRVFYPKPCFITESF